MSSPSFENIDQWLFEYTEGNLSPTQEEHLMNFIQEHPELIDELKAWKKTKVAPIAAAAAFNSSSLLKPTPILLKPASIAIMSFVILIGTWLVFKASVVETPQYSKANIDTDFIVIGNSTDSWTNLIVQTESNTEIEAQASRIQKTGSSSSDSNLNTHSQNNINRYGTDIPTRNASAISSEVSNEALTYKSSSSSENENIYSSTADLTKASFSNTGFYAPELNAVIASLNGESLNKDLVEDELLAFEEELEEVSTSSKSTHNAEITKPTFKKSLNSSIRKIKKMIEQPTALRTTQSPYFHTPMMTGYRTNSAMAGSVPGNRIQATSRLQWITHENSQVKNTVSYDGYIYSLRGGLGVDFNYNTYNSNAINNYSLGLVYSPKFNITKNIMFAPAISFKMGVVDIDQNSDFIGNKIEWNRNNAFNFFNEEEKATGKQLWYKDVGLGFMLNTKAFYVGFNADNLGRHNNNFYSSDLSKKHREHVYLTAVAGTEYQSLTRNFSINAYALFQNYGKLSELWTGANFQYKWIQVGAGVNTKADFALSTGVIFNHVTLHYNIDYIKSQLLERKHLSHQVSLKVLLKPSRNTTKFFSF